MMKYRDKQNLKFVKKKISQEILPVPDALNEENISRLLYAEAEPKIKVSKPKHIAAKSVISIAACLVIVLSAISVRDFFSSDNIHKCKEYSSENTNDNEYSEIKKQIDEIQKYNELNVSYENGFWLGLDGTPGEDVIYESDDINGSTGTSNSTSHGETYTQVEGVAEADIIQNDGKYIYVADHYHTFISIYEANGEKAEVFSYVDLGFVDYIYDMYLYEDKLIVNYDSDSYATDKTSTQIFDISDKANPELLTTLIQDGDYISSRIIDNQLYVATNKRVKANPEELKDYVPTLIYNNEEAQFIPAEDIYCIDDIEIASYVVVSSYNLDNGKKYTDSKAVLGAGTNIYCSENNLYVISENIYYKFDRFVDGESGTNILKFSLNDGNIEFVADTKVKGITNNQYSFDEKDGYLRVATTYTSKNYVEYNGLFVFDKNLEQVGSVTGFAKNESIEAVKFIGDMAYVITFEHTDPLFVIDLSDPTKPEIKGEVEITGFSSMLHPVDENTLLGIGYANEVLPTGEWVDGIKLALFDISDPENPTVLDSEIFKDCYSDAQYNPKAFMVNNHMGYYAIPFELYYPGNNNSGAITFEIVDNQIEITNKYTFESDVYYDTSYYFLRCTYIDEYLYLVGMNWVDESFNIQGYKYSE